VSDIERGAARLVTLSATYGTGGSVVGPRLAERLGIAFLDRLVAPVTVPPAIPSECISEEERAATPTSKWLWALARIPSVVAAAPIPASVDLDPDTEIRNSSERAIRELVAAGDGLVLGRAAAIVLAAEPRAFHVRLDGPVKRRLEHAMAVERIEADVARKRLNETDKMRTLFVRRLYDRDPADAALYHLVIDSTVLPVDTVVDVCANAATSFWRHARR
jgi:cytidylate kinase